MFRLRLSPHFLLIDFLYDRANYMQPAPLTGQFLSDEAVRYGTALCHELLEPLMHHVGPCSVAAGVVFEGTDQHAQGPHGWHRARGAAADVVFHRWVNNGLDPAGLIGEALNHCLAWSRWIAYAGTEFSCLAYQPGNHLMSTYVNRRPARRGEKPFFQQIRPPITSGPRPNPDWRREPGETVYHTRRTLRAQHVRVGHYFTLLDFCRSEVALTHGIASVPPPTSMSHIVSAHQAAHLLDQVVNEVGRVSVLLGIESASAREISGRTDTEWRQDPNQPHAVEFAFPEGVGETYANAVLGRVSIPEGGGERQVRVEGHLVIGRLVWLPFDVPRWFTSAAVPANADHETVYQAIQADIRASRAGVLT